MSRDRHSGSCLSVCRSYGSSPLVGPIRIYGLSESEKVQSVAMHDNMSSRLTQHGQESTLFSHTKVHTETASRA